jgi:hypothetical protein
VLLGAGASAGAIESVTLSAQGAAILTNIPRMGLNLGGSSYWGADQLMANVLRNPGFEAPFDRTLVVVKEVSGADIVDDNVWLGRADGFWDGGRFDVRTGKAAGLGGTITASRRQGGTGAGMFTLNPYPAGLVAGDAVVVGISRAAPAAPLWWVGGSGNVDTTTVDIRPGSLGRQSARMTGVAGTRTQLNHYLDTIGDRAGKLLPLTGTWRLGFWARGTALNEQLDVRFARDRWPAFLYKNIVLGNAWEYYEFDFAPDDSGYAGPLSLSFETTAGIVLLDDVSLSDTRIGAGGFRPEVVNMLNTLKPGYLRDWQGQLGDTLANRLAPQFARRPNRYRPGDAEQKYLYSLPEFLELCAAVGAQPWVLAPSLLSDSEWRDLGAYLAQEGKRLQFREILVEFGNENWNSMFRPAGFMGEARQAEAADRGFRLLKEGAGSYKNIVPIVNAQFVNPYAWGKLASASQHAARVAVAPYFLFDLNQMTPEQAQAAAFADSSATMVDGVTRAAAFGKKVSVYEVNFHTTGGTADVALRNMAIDGAHSGAALARRLLQATLAGVREQAVYTLAAFESYTNTNALMRLWGIARDLAPGQLRPTGMALAMMNQAVGGSAYASSCSGASCNALTSAWFVSGTKSRLVVASAAATTILVKTTLACDKKFNLSLLDGTNPNANNETAGLVRVAISKTSPACVGNWQFELPPYSVATLIGEGDNNLGEFELPPYVAGQTMAGGEWGGVSASPAVAVPVAPVVVAPVVVPPVVVPVRPAPAHAYQQDAAGNILWAYYDGVTPNGRLDNASYGPRGEIYGASRGFPVFASNFATQPPLGAPQTLSLDLTPKANFTLKESRNIKLSSIALSGDDQSNIKVAPGKQLDVWVTFFSQSASYENSIGFFTYDVRVPPLSDTSYVNRLRTEQIIFSRPSSPWPMPNAGNTGITVYLGKFDGGSMGLGIGFFLATNGWGNLGRTFNGVKVGGVKENQNKDWIFYSLRGLNPETGAGFLNQHAILLKDSLLKGTDQRDYQRLLFGFEDLRRDQNGSDNDFNDALMVIHAAPVDRAETIGNIIENLGTLPQLLSPPVP